MLLLLAQSYTDWPQNAGERKGLRQGTPPEGRKLIVPQWILALTPVRSVLCDYYPSVSQPSSGASMFRCPNNGAAMTPSTSSASQCSTHALPQIHRSLQGRRLRRAASNGARCTAFFKFKNPLRGSSEEAGRLAYTYSTLTPTCLPIRAVMHAHVQASMARSRAMTTARMTSSTTSTTWACWPPRCAA